MTIIERVMTRVSPEPMSGCWLWVGWTDDKGYGRIKFGSRKGARVHRVLFEQIRGPVPVGKELDHLCRVRCCLNPAHLEPVTHAENCRRGNGGHQYRDRITCGRGHALDEANTHWLQIPGKANSIRRCRICGRDKMREYRAKRAVA